MTQLLIQGSAILAVGPFEQAADSIVGPDAIFPKHVLDGWHIVEADLPPDFSTGAYRWDGADLVFAETDLTVLKEEKNEQINRWREGANFSSFAHAGKLIACDALSRSDIDGVANNIALFGTFPAGFPGAWKTVDNSFIELPDVDAFKALYASMTAQGAANFQHAQDLKLQLTAAGTADAIAAIAW